MPDKPKSQDGATFGQGFSERTNASYPETAKSLFDPVVHLANLEMAEVTCRMFDAIVRDRALEFPRQIILTDDDL